MEYCGEVITHGEFRRRTIQYSEEDVQHFYFMSLGAHTVRGISISDSI